MAETLDNFLVTITDSFGIIENGSIILDSKDITDPVNQILFESIKKELSFL